MSFLLDFFDSPIDDSVRDLVWRSLGPLRVIDFPIGPVSLRLPGDHEVTVTIDQRASTLLRLVDRILRRQLEEKYRALFPVAQPRETGDVSNISWRALALVRRKGFQHGRYHLELEEGGAFEFTIGRWDATLLEQFDAFIYELYRKNWWIVEAALDDVATRPKSGTPRERAA